MYFKLKREKVPDDLKAEKAYLDGALNRGGYKNARRDQAA